MPKTYLRFSHYSHFFLFNLNVLSRVVFTSHVISRAREPGLLSSQHPVTAFQLLVPGVTGAAGAGTVAGARAGAAGAIEAALAANGDLIVGPAGGRPTQLTLQKA